MLASLLQSLLPLVGQLLAAALLALATWAVTRLADWLKLSADDKVRSYLLQIVEVAVAAAQAEVARQGGLGGHGAVANAAAYVQERAPDALRRFRLDDEALRSMISQRLLGRGR